MLALIPLLVVWDDYRHREPVAELVGVGIGLFGFLLVWPAYPVVGAVLAHVGPLAALLALLRPGSA